MNREQILGYKPIGKSLPPEKWINLTSATWRNEEWGGSAFAHVITFEGEDVLFVLNGKDRKYADQKPGWKIPTEEIGNGESPYEGARRAIREEVLRNKIDATKFQVERKPLWVSRDKHGHFHFVFSASIDADVNIPERCDDPAHEVTEIRFVNLAEIEITPDPEKPGSNKLSLNGMFVLPISIGLISLTMR